MKVSNRKENKIWAKHLLYSLARTGEISEHLKDNGWNSIDQWLWHHDHGLHEKHFGSDILRANSLFSKR